MQAAHLDHHIKATPVHFLTPQASEEEAMRGFKVEKQEARDVVCDRPLLYYVRDAETSTAPLASAQ